jgi:diaminohydroxyphosphoribosylaminopyrimidine deaminase/5-amino-6-(5-phosphoribosylamino)uracil reductase
MASAAALEDQRLMRLAIGMAERGLGRCAPNPAVGAVIAREGVVIARGWTAPGGRPHAETQALARAGRAARGATMAVTLEPCSHHGKTPPCAEALIAAGIARVLVGAGDPDGRVAGHGVAMLRAAGIEVVERVCEAQARWITLGHILRVTGRRPFVQVKMALAADGTVPLGGQGTPVWATGELARAHGHLLRAEADAILVGRRTVDDDDPELTCRLPGMANRSPVRVVLDTGLQISSKSRLVRSAGAVPLWLVCGPEASAEREAELKDLGCEVLRCDQRESRIEIGHVLGHLAGRGITRLLVEGGRAVWTSFAKAASVDEIVLYQARSGELDASSMELSARHALSRHLSKGLAASTLTAARDLGSDRMHVFRSL